MEIEEGVVPRQVSTPEQPTRREIEEHELTHYPYKAWCKFCVQGRAICDPHRRLDDDESMLEKNENAVTTRSVDYGYLNEDMEINEDGEADPEHQLRVSKSTLA